MLLVNRLTLLAKMDIQHDPFYNYVKTGCLRLRVSYFCENYFVNFAI